jgi:tripartite-type tricarboxylate transporter receptor subunit TctC
VKQFPEVPTLAEAGVPGYEFTAWIGAFVPAGTPQPIVDRLGAEIKKALDNPDVARILSSQTLDPWFMTPAEFAERLKSDDEKYERLMKLTGAKIG